MNGNIRLIGILVLVMVVLASVQVVGAETAHVANHVVISELFYDETGTDCNEFCELYNPTDSDIDIGEWELKAFNQVGALQTTTTFSVGATIGAHKFYLIGEKDPLNSNDWGGTEISPDCLRGGSDWQNGPGDYIILYDDSDNYVDGIKYGSKEGSPEIIDCPEYSNVGPGKSIERKAIASSTPDSMAPSGDHYTWGNGEDTNNNSADFITKTTPEPQNSSSATEDSPSQSWFLSNTSGSDYIMYKGDMSKIEGTVTVSDDNSTIWRANEPATVDVGFPAGTWTGEITLGEPFASGETFTVEVGSYEGSTFTSAGLQTCTGATDKITFSLEIPATAFDILNGNYLALNITNPSDGSADLVIKTGDGNSYVTSPETDPGYPVPELSTLLLFSIGLIALAGYVLLTKRRN